MKGECTIDGPTNLNVGVAAVSIKYFGGKFFQVFLLETPPLRLETVPPPTLDPKKPTHHGPPRRPRLPTQAMRPANGDQSEGARQQQPTRQDLL
jgi:hypothetical protein